MLETTPAEMKRAPVGEKANEVGAAEMRGGAWRISLEPEENLPNIFNPLLDTNTRSSGRNGSSR